MLGIPWLISRFYRLVDYPIDKGTEICFRATAFDNETKCEDLPHWLEPEGCSTWHPLGAERHLAEWLVVLSGSMLILYVTVWRNPPKDNQFRRHPLAFPFVAAGIYHFSYYEWFWNMPERGWLLTPCHTGWSLRMILHFIPMSDGMANAFRQTMICFSSLAALFIFQPDGEVNDAFRGRFTWSLWHHILLLYMPVHDLCLGHVAVLPPPSYKSGQRYSDLKYFFKWHVVAIAMYIFIYGVVGTPIALVSGANWGLTVHFHLTQMAEAIHLTGPNYRVWWFLYCNLFFIMVRLSLAVMDQLLRDFGFSVFSRAHQKQAWLDYVESKVEAKRAILKKEE